MNDDKSRRPLTIDPWLREILRCPACRAELRDDLEDAIGIEVARPRADPQRQREHADRRDRQHPAHDHDHSVGDGVHQLQQMRAPRMPNASV